MARNKFKDQFTRMVKEKYDKEFTLDGVLNYFFEKNLLNEVTCKSAVIKYHYEILRKFHNSTYSIEQLSSSYFISTSTVRNYLYRSDVDV